MSRFRRLEEGASFGEWDAYAASRDAATPFHLSSWMRVLRETYGFRPVCLAVAGESGRIEGILPLFEVRGLFGARRVVSAPFSDYCGPVLDRPEDAGELAGRLVSEVAGGARYVEIRGGAPMRGDWPVLLEYRRHAIPLCPDAEAAYDRFDRKTIRYSIRKAVRDGIGVERSDSLDGVEAFYRLNVLTRRKHGVPSQPWEFFRNLHESMFPGGGAFVMLATLRGKAVAGGLFLRFRDTIYYKYNASDPDALKTHTPNHLLTWEAIRAACAGGFRSFDFGRTSVRNGGLIRYKEMWGAVGTDLPYFYYPETGGVNAGARGPWYDAATAAWKRLPAPVAERISRHVFRYMA